MSEVTESNEIKTNEPYLESSEDDFLQAYEALAAKKLNESADEEAEDDSQPEEEQVDESEAEDDSEDGEESEVELEAADSDDEDESESNDEDGDEESDDTADDEDEEKKSDDEDESDEDEDKEHTPNRFKKRLDRAKKRAREEAKKEYESEIERLKQEVESAKESSMSDEDKKELLMWRRREAAEKDPQIQEKYADAIDANNEAIMEEMSRILTPESYSKFKDLDVNEYYRSHRSEFDDFLDGDDINKSRAEEVRYLLRQNADLTRKKNREINRLAKESEEYWKEREQKARQSQEEQKKQQEQLQKSLSDVVEKVNQSKEFSDLKIPSGATEDEKKRIKGINDIRAKMREKVGDIKNLNMSKTVQAVVRAAKADELEYENKMLNERLKEMEKRVSGIKKAGKTKKVKGSETPKPKSQWLDVSGMSAADIMDNVESGAWVPVKTPDGIKYKKAK